MTKYCNNTRKGAACVACEHAHKAALDAAGCIGWGQPTSKLSRFCAPQPAPPPAPPSPGTPDCPNGPAKPCREPATPVIAAGYASSNLFWPGESDAEGNVYTCTYCPMVTLVNGTRLVAVGGCTPSGCPGCNGIHVSDDAKAGWQGRQGWQGSDGSEGSVGAGTTCTRGCIKHSDDGGKTWSKIRAFTEYSPGGMINYDRVSNTLLLQFPDSHGQFVRNPGAVLQMASRVRAFYLSAPF